MRSIVHIYECGRVVVEIRVRVLHSAIIIDVQAAIRMVVVIGILVMHDQVFDLTRSLRDGCRAQCCY